MENQIQTQISGIIEYYYATCDASTLWDIVCDELDVDYDDEEIGQLFDQIFKNFENNCK